MAYIDLTRSCIAECGMVRAAGRNASAARRGQRHGLTVTLVHVTFPSSEEAIKGAKDALKYAQRHGKMWQNIFD